MDIGQWAALATIVAVSLVVAQQLWRVARALTHRGEEQRRRDRLVIDALLELTFQLPQSPRRTRILRQLGHELDILNKSA